MSFDSFLKGCVDDCVEGWSEPFAPLVVDEVQLDTEELRSALALAIDLMQMEADTGPVRRATGALGTALDTLRALLDGLPEPEPEWVVDSIITAVDEARDLLAQIVKARDEEDTRGLHELIEFARTLLAEGPPDDCVYIGGNEDPRKRNSGRCPRHGAKEVTP